jgi:hypothetical protein
MKCLPNKKLQTNGRRNEMFTEQEIANKRAEIKNLKNRLWLLKREIEEHDQSKCKHDWRDESNWHESWKYCLICGKTEERD